MMKFTIMENDSSDISEWYFITLYEYLSDFDTQL